MLIENKAKKKIGMFYLLLYTETRAGICWRDSLAFVRRGRGLVPFLLLMSTRGESIVRARRRGGCEHIPHPEEWMNDVPRWAFKSPPPPPHSPSSDARLLLLIDRCVICMFQCGAPHPHPSLTRVNNNLFNILCMRGLKKKQIFSLLIVNYCQYITKWRIRKRHTILWRRIKQE